MNCYFCNDPYNPTQLTWLGLGFMRRPLCHFCRAKTGLNNTASTPPEDGSSAEELLAEMFQEVNEKLNRARRLG